MSRAGAEVTSAGRGTRNVLAGWLSALTAWPAAATEVHLAEPPADGVSPWWLLLSLLPLAAGGFFLKRRESRRGTPAGDGAGEGGLAGLPLDEESFRRLVASLDLTHSAQERSYIDVIGAMVATAHARDHETIGHSFRVARYSVELARRMGMAEATLTAVEWGALLHDVGKVSVPQDVLRKSGPLTEAEKRVMQQHPRRGYQMLKGLLFLGTGLDVVLSHHERWDGRGYPNGLSREQIPLSARIFAVADTYDAITSDRPYRAARGHAEAVAELQRVSGSQLDPAVVAAFLTIPESTLDQLRDLTRPVDEDSDSATFRVTLDEDESLTWTKVSAI
jgi:putative nucleotidyltransferase with HDIG domain